jgi:hypothetical protein
LRLIQHVLIFCLTSQESATVLSLIWIEEVRKLDHPSIETSILALQSSNFWFLIEMLITACNQHFHADKPVVQINYRSRDNDKSK